MTPSFDLFSVHLHSPGDLISNIMTLNTTYTPMTPNLCCCCCVASMRPHRRQPTRILCPWDSPGKNTGVGGHFLLRCMKVKSESEVTQSCLTLRNPMDCSLLGSSVHGIFQAKVLEWVAISFTEFMSSAQTSPLTSRLNHLLHISIQVSNSYLKFNMIKILLLNLNTPT